MRWEKSNDTSTIPYNNKTILLDIKELLWACERFVSLVGSFLSINKLGVAVVIHLFPFRDKQSSKGDDDCQNNVQWPKNLKRKMWKLLGVTDHVTNILLCTSGTFGLYVDNHFRSFYKIYNFYSIDVSKSILFDTSITVDHHINKMLLHWTFYKLATSTLKMMQNENMFLPFPENDAWKIT